MIDQIYNIFYIHIFFQFTHKQLNSKHWTSIWIAYSMYVYLYVNRYYAEMYWWIAWYYIQQGIIFITQRNIFRNFYQELYFCVCVRPLFPQVLLSIWHAHHNNKSRKSTTLTKFCKTHFIIAKKVIPFEMAFVYIPRNLEDGESLECFSISSNQNLGNF